MSKMHLVIAAMSAASLIINWLWINMPLSAFGVSGRQAILYGRITLLQTFLYPHPYMILWASGFSLNILAILLLASARYRKISLPPVILMAAGLSTLLLWLLIMSRWNFSTALAPMYMLGLPTALIPILGGLAALWRMRSRMG
ncbi:hypothetical protein HRbin01_00099 [archaeon HR01]|nr:hypothetical protein HRbin01_00099 [archaeon HR01]